ncbi:MaoC family dehydratase N-terminal domain-containing protein [Nonomuraea sp. NPDC005650]|uniref:FAS1-like dehydratase domain-containing protein n=1 Tax=Nonomuraea sp. NPDC005650 TaxID=3157045 RepID=UPI0033B04B10
MNQARTDEQFGVLTDAALERSRGRLGIPIPQPNPPHNYEVTRDAVRHFAQGYGDDNPLYCDPAYAKTSRWEGVIAPPTFLYTMGEDIAPQPDAETRALLKGDPFAGLGSYQAVMEYEWWRPLRLGDSCRLLVTQVGVAAKLSKFGGRAAHVTKDYVYANGQDQVVALRRGTWINAERHTSKKRAKEAVTFEPYTPEQLKEIDTLYAVETRRGADPRYWEEVEVGDELQPRVKGPLKTTDIVVWHVGWGMQLTPPGSFRLAYQVRRKAPGLFPPDPLNIPDTVQRLHWDPIRARELGLPTSYDYGGMRETWLVHAITDWIGDDAWLWRLRCEHRKFNYIGDTTWVRGNVSAKRVVDGHHVVDLDLRCENQRGEITTPASATVILPTRAEAIALPQPPAPTIDGVVAADIERFSIG